MDNIDLDKIENKKELQLYLKRIKPFNKFKENEDVPLEYLEKLIKTICNKYPLKLGSISCDPHSNKKRNIWKVMLYSINPSETKKTKYEYLYGLSIYEALAKTCIRLYEKVKENKNEN